MIRIKKEMVIALITQIFFNTRIFFVIIFNAENLY